jgi:hypothetical protein
MTTQVTVSLYDDEIDKDILVTCTVAPGSSGGRHEPPSSPEIEDIVRVETDTPRDETSEVLWDGEKGDEELAERLYENDKLWELAIEAVPDDRYSDY